MMPARQPDPIGVLIVDDHIVVRQGIRRLLEDSGGIHVVGEAGDGEEAVQKVEALRPRVVLMDIGLPKVNGLEATRRIVEQRPETRVVILTMHDNEGYVEHVFSIGAKGYITKDSGGENLINAIKVVDQGGSFLLSGQRADGGTARIPGKSRGIDCLTAREKQVMVLLAQGYPNREIGEKLGIKTKTVEVHRTNIMKKLDIHSIVALVKLAIREGLVDL